MPTLSAGIGCLMHAMNKSRIPLILKLLIDTGCCLFTFTLCEVSVTSSLQLIRLPQLWISESSFSDGPVTSVNCYQLNDRPKSTRILILRISYGLVIYDRSHMDEPHTRASVFDAHFGLFGLPRVLLSLKCTSGFDSGPISGDISGFRFQRALRASTPALIFDAPTRL